MGHRCRPYRFAATGAPVFFIEFAATGEEGADALIQLSRAPPSPSPSVMPLFLLYSLSLSPPFLPLEPPRGYSSLSLSLTHTHTLSLTHSISLSPSLPLPLSRAPNLHILFPPRPPRPPRLASLALLDPRFTQSRTLRTSRRTLRTSRRARTMPRSARARRAPAGAVVCSYPERHNAARSIRVVSHAYGRGTIYYTILY